MAVCSGGLATVGRAKTRLLGVLRTPLTTATHPPHPRTDLGLSHSDLASWSPSCSSNWAPHPRFLCSTAQVWVYRAGVQGRSRSVDWSRSPIEGLTPTRPPTGYATMPSRRTWLGRPSCWSAGGCTTVLPTPAPLPSSAASSQSSGFTRASCSVRNRRR